MFTLCVHIFRLNPHVAFELCNWLRPYLEGQRRHHIPVHVQVLVSLRFFATGSYQKVLQQDYFHPVAQPTISKFLDKVVSALVDLSPQFIKFPATPQQRYNTQLR